MEAGLLSLVVLCEMELRPPVFPLERQAWFGFFPKQLLEVVLSS